MKKEKRNLVEILEEEDSDSWQLEVDDDCFGVFSSEYEDDEDFDE